MERSKIDKRLLKHNNTINQPESVKNYANSDWSFRSIYVCPTNVDKTLFTSRICKKTRLINNKCLKCYKK